MFEKNQQAAADNRYQIDWITEPELSFNTKVNAWLQKLNRNPMLGGPGSTQRKAMTSEFLVIMTLYDFFLKQQRSALRQSGVGNTDLSMMELDFAVQTSERRFKVYEQLHRNHFNTMPTMSQDYQSLHAGVEQVIRQVRGPELKLRTIEKKIKVVDYWINGLNDFPQHIAGLDLFLQYLGNAPMEKVKAVLNVMLQDAAKMMKMPDPTAKFQHSLETQSGLSATRSTEWTDEDFKSAVRAEIGASFGARVNVAGSLAVTGLKARMSAEAFAGARTKAAGQMAFSRNGIAASAEIDVTIGIEIQIKAEMEIGDIFMLEVGGDAFAGALARAKAEFSATWQGVKVNLEAEAFAGARITGQASFGFKIQGYEIMKGTAKGSLTAGVGASFKLDFESTLFGGTKFALEAGLTTGLGMEGGAEIAFQGDNLGLAVNALYYRAYNYLTMDDRERHAYWEYFRTLEDNMGLFKKAKEELEKFRRQAELEYDTAANANVKIAIIKKLADSQWSRRTHEPIRVKLPTAADRPLNPQTGQPVGRARSNAVIRPAVAAAGRPRSNAVLARQGR